MIEIKNLNNIPLEEIFDDAKDYTLYQNSEWTNLQESDPGITILEMFSWLKYVQHEYLNRISDSVKLKFLKLLDVFPYANNGSTTLIEASNIENTVELPVRSKFKSRSMIFENLYQQAVIKAKILSVVFENPEFKYQEEYYKFDGKKSFFLFGKDTTRGNKEDEIRSFTINFDSSLPKNSIVNLYFSVHESGGQTRNPITDEDTFESMAKVRWEYYGNKNGKDDWYELEILKDETYNFLFSGIIKIRLDSEMIPIDQEYKIRVVLEYDEYDYPPRVDNILTNVFKVVQNNTRCQNIVIKKEDILTNRTILLRDNMAIYGDSEIYFKYQGGWVKTNKVALNRDIENGEVVLDLSKIWDEIKTNKHNEESIMVVSYEKNCKNKMTLGSATGISGQNYAIKFKNLLLDDLEIMIGENIHGKEVFYKWTRVNDFFSSNKYDRHYVYDKNQSILIFGDHEHGMAAPKGKNNIKICNLRETFAGNSNIKEGSIKSILTENINLKDCKIKQIVSASGGCNEETLEHAQARASEIFNNSQRAVTYEDYEKIVKSTPGLMFTNVKILPNYMPGEDVSKQNCVTIAVRWNKKVGLTLSKSFEKNIINHIEKCRLMNTKVKVVSPYYVGLIISGTIVVDSSYRSETQEIEKQVFDFIDNLNTQMGRVLHFGDMFGVIDRIKYVNSISSLKILTNSENSNENISDDIVVPPNAVYYIDSINFNYLKSSEF